MKNIGDAVSGIFLAIAVALVAAAIIASCAYMSAPVPRDRLCPMSHTLLVEKGPGGHERLVCVEYVEVIN